MALLAGCGTAPPAPEAPGEAPPLPIAWYTSRENVYSVDPQRSKILLFIRKDGLLAGLGHNHVIRVGDLAGLVHVDDDLARARADLAFSAVGLELDPAAERAAAGPDFASKLTTGELTATRQNLLGPDVLSALEYPFIHIRIRPLAREASTLRLLAEVTLKGITHAYETHAELTLSAGTIELEGALTVSQKDFGIVAFSILGGAISVRDEVQVRYRVRALLTPDS